MAERGPRDRRTVLVVGGGMGGLTAAIRASEQGAAVTLIEKAPDLTHSSTFIAGGGFTIHVKPYGELTPAELVLAFQETSDYLCDLDLVSIFARRLAADFAWLKDDLGLSFTPNLARRGGFMVNGRGSAIPPFLQTIARSRGVDIQFNTKAIRLITDDRGRVVGVEVSTPDGHREVSAGAVVLATGSFESNEKLVKEYLGEQAYETAFMHRVSPPGHTGDGQLIAMELGASFAKHPFMIHCGAEDKAWEKPGVRPRNQGGPTRALLKTSRWGLWINRNGKRFVDESSESDAVATAIMRQPGGVAALVFDQKIHDRFPDESQRYAEAVPGAIRQCRTLQEIARAIDAPASRLEATVREFNDSISRNRAMTLEVPKGAYMPTGERIDTPPFYAVYPVYCSMNTIWGGLEVDNEARVLHQSGKPIPGLYAAGAIFGGIFNGIWSETPSGVQTYQSNHDVLATSLQVCLVFGSIAGEKAASYVAGVAEP